MDSDLHKKIFFLCFSFCEGNKKPTQSAEVAFFNVNCLEIIGDKKLMQEMGLLH